MPKSQLFAALLLVAFASPASAQQPPAVRIRGTIEAVDGAMLSIKSRDGADMKVRTTDNVAVFGVAKTDLSEIKPGSYIGVTAMPEPDGMQKAIAVHIFPENQRGAAEGFRPWDLRANSTMTNATVAETVKGTDGQNITVKYKDGEKKVVVPPATPVVTFVAGDKSELKPGAKIIIFGAVKKDDGTLEANRVNVGARRDYAADVKRNLSQHVVPAKAGTHSRR
ncbi:outer membrane lipoprotein SlyB [Bradyrhizobium elkanii]